MADNPEPVYVPMEKRPDEVPEKFWHPEKGLNVTGIAGAYKTLESSRESYKAQLEADLRKELAPPPPPDNYQLPEFKPDGLPEGFDFKLDEDPMVNLLRKAATGAGLQQDAFDKVVTTYAEDKAARFRALGDDARKLLGEDATGRTNRVIGKLKEQLGDEGYQAVSAVATSPRAVLALEKLLGNAPPRPGGSDPGGDALTPEKLRQMQMDPRYWDPSKRDPAFVKQIEDGWARLAPGRIQGGAGVTG